LVGSIAVGSYWREYLLLAVDRLFPEYSGLGELDDGAYWLSRPAKESYNNIDV